MSLSHFYKSSRVCKNNLGENNLVVYIMPMNTIFAPFLRFITLMTYFILLHLSFAHAIDYTVGINITEMGGDTSYQISPIKTKAQVAIDQAAQLGMKHIVLNVRAHQIGPRSSDIRFVFLNEQQETTGLRDIVSYARQKGLTVGIRPILLVLGPKGEFPYQEKDHLWWHGNIKPQEPKKWFDAFEKFILFYSKALQGLPIQEFTIGAEMQSMTVGMGDNSSAYLIGQPERWLQLLHQVRAQHPDIAITYDINFPETKVPLSGNIGGEFERWRYLIVELEKDKSPEVQKKRQAIIQLWKEFDFIGLDFYRYLASSTLNLPTDYIKLVDKLTQTALMHATQIDNALSDIELTLGVSKKLVIKEIGYRSVKACFVNPASYSSSGGELNIMHQAASYYAISNAFIKPNWPWFQGIYFWEISTNTNLSGPKDIGFSPFGKPQTEEVIFSEFLRSR